jgi:phospholipase A-2-activating protein
VRFLRFFTLRRSLYLSLPVGRNRHPARTTINQQNELSPPHQTRTIKIWRGSECIQTLEGHEGPVLSLAVTPSGDILSGSGDTTIRRWSGGKCVQTYKGHTDTVR